MRTSTELSAHSVDDEFTRSGRINSLVSVELEDKAEDEAPRRSPRLHHLDWLRSCMIFFAVFCHVWQTLHFPPQHAADDVVYTSEPTTSAAYYLRWVQLGRLVCIPLLFFVSGAALALGPYSAASSGRGIGPTFLKVGVLTLAGLALNGLIFLAGPRDERCSLEMAEKLHCKGPLMDFLIAPNAGSLFPILYQFWYTLFLLLFLAEDAPLYRELLSLSTGGEPSLPRLLLRWLAASALYVLAGLAPPALHLQDVLLLVAAEAAFLGCVCGSARAAAAGAGPAVRLWQYGAAAAAVLQFGVPRFQITTFDTNLVLYYHAFRQLMTLGFVVTLTRASAAPVASRAWPLVLFGLILLCPSTSFTLAGMITYPWFPKTADRLLWLGGSFVVPLALDRIGRTFAAAGADLPLPASVGVGTLLLYFVHPLFIAVFARFPVFRSEPFLLTTTALVFCCLAGLALTGRRRPT